MMKAMFAVLVCIQIILGTGIKFAETTPPREEKYGKHEQVVELHQHIMDTCQAETFRTVASRARVAFEGNATMQQLGQRWLTSSGVRSLMEDFFKNYNQNPEYFRANGLFLALVNSCISDVHYNDATAFGKHFAAALKQAEKLFVAEGAIHNLVTELKKMNKVEAFLFKTGQSHTHLVKLITSATRREGCVSTRSRWESHARREEAQQYPPCYYTKAGVEEDPEHAYSCGQRLEFMVVNEGWASAGASNYIACQYPAECYCLGFCCNEESDNYDGNCACYDYVLREHGRVLEVNFTNGAIHNAAFGFGLWFALTALLGNLQL